MLHQTLIAATAWAALVATAPASALTLAFSGSGVVNGPAPVPPATFNGLTIEPGSNSYSLGGDAGWAADVAFSGEVQWTVIDPGTITFLGWSGTMAGQFQRGSDRLFFTGTQASPGLEAPIVLSYTITGGAGRFAGYTGTGQSNVLLLGNPFGLPTPVPFMETDGVLNLQPVPEPASWALWLAGLALAALAAQRRPAVLRRLGAVQGVRT